MKVSALILCLFLMVATGCGGGGGGGSTAAYTVDFGANGGVVITSPGTVAVIETEPEATKAGYDFIGWFDNPSLTGARLVFPYILAKDTTLYAKWQPICTPSDPSGKTEIRNVNDLLAISASATGNYILMDNISLSSIPSWTPIADFKGEFYGNCYVISDLMINSVNPGDGEKFGLFATLDSAYIDGLRLENVDIAVSGTGSTILAGAIAGGAKSGLIRHSYATGKINVDVATSSIIGGLVGMTETNIVMIDGSYSAVNVTGNANTMMNGGIVGATQQGQIVNSYSTGTVSGGQSVGGIAGYLTDAKVSNSYSTGTVSSNYTGGQQANSGGIAGAADDGSTIEYSYSSGAVTNLTKAGGILAAFQGISLINSVAVNPSVTAPTAGRIVPTAIIDSSTIADNLALDTMWGNFSPAEAGYGVSKTDTELKTQATYEAIGWKFGNDKDNPWVMLDGGAYPVLYWQ